MIKRIESDLIKSNVFIVSQDDNCVIIDAGVEPGKLEIEGNVLGIFLTHAHYDHAFFALEYAKKFNCKIFASKFAEEYLRNPDYNYSKGKLKIDDFNSFVFLDSQGELKLKNITIDYKTLGGHSKSDMMYKIEDDIFVGDVLIGRDMGRTDLYGGDKLKMKESLEYLLNENYSIMHCGHGEDFNKFTQNKVINLWLKYLNR